MAKSSALQRISNYWIIIQEWWAMVMAKAVRSYIRHAQSDEKMVTSSGGQFINVWIRQIELSGEIGDVEPEVSETFPVSWAQKRDIFMNLMQLKDPTIGSILAHPENSSLVAATIGVPEMYLPGEDSRAKQLREIAELLQGQPQELPDQMTGQMVPHSTVPIDPELDDNKVEAETCKAWLTGEVGQDAKRTNPSGYANVRAHWSEHNQADQQAMMAQAQAQAPAPGGGGQGPQDISGEPNAA